MVGLSDLILVDILKRPANIIFWSRLESTTRSTSRVHLVRVTNQGHLRAWSQVHLELGDECTWSMETSSPVGREGSIISSAVHRLSRFYQCTSYLVGVQVHRIFIKSTLKISY